MNKSSGRSQDCGTVPTKADGEVDEGEDEEQEMNC